MDNNQSAFNSRFWQMELFNITNVFERVDELLSGDGQLLARDKQRKRADEFFKKTGLSRMEDLLDHGDFVSDGVQIFRRQTIVLLVTYIEQICKDFLESLFASNPGKMARYLLAEDSQDSKAITEFERLLTLSVSTSNLEELAQIAVTKATRGKLIKIIRRIEQLSDGNIEQKEILVKLSEVRNRIVHEASKQDISASLCLEGLHSLRHFVISLNEACQRNNISFEE